MPATVASVTTLVRALANGVRAGRPNGEGLCLTSEAL